MNLIIDIGNTRTKLAVFDNQLLLHSTSVSKLKTEILETFLDRYPGLNNAILSTVKDYPEESNFFLQKKFEQFIELDHQTPVPIKNSYHTPETLGLDRLAAVIGASSLFTDDNILVIDAGTAVTYDIIRNKEYLGGNISPGLEVRFKALNQFTGRLPVVSKKSRFSKLGKNTESAIRAGVQLGMIFEMEQMIEMFNESYKNLKVILTGGDAFFFDGKLKNTIFVQLYLSQIGLNQILLFNNRDLF